tara:strand:- start:620 stop:1195 length:576 start_codon:yes stop_codon:yes gene_type:complete
MARQKTKFSDKFGSGGSKETSKEASLFGDSELEETPEFKAMHLLMDQIDELTDVINANDAGSGSFASDIKNLTTDSGSFSTRVTANDAKVSMVIGTKDTQAKAGNTTTISDAQASAITANTKKVSMVIGTKSTQALAGNTTTISTEQATLLTALVKGITNTTGHQIKLSLNDAGALVISINRSTYTISADR